MFKNRNNTPTELQETAINIDTQIQVSKDYDRSVPLNNIANVNNVTQSQIHAIVTKIRQAATTEVALKNAVSELQTILAADRVLVCQAIDAQSGKILAEVVRNGYTPSLGAELALMGFGEATLAEYSLQRYVQLENDNTQVSPYQKQLLDTLQVKSQITFPILLSSYSSDSSGYGMGETWGLLCIQQCSKSRKWTESEVNFLAQISLELTLAIQPSLPLLQLVQNRDPLNTISLEARHLMQGLSDQIRATFQADRVMVYAFNPDWSGNVVVESVDVNWPKAETSLNWDYTITESNYKPYYAVNDIETKGLAQALLDVLAPLKVRAYLVVPVVYNGSLLGLVGVYQNSGPRNWRKQELEALQELATRFQTPLQQTVYQRHQQFQAAQMNLRFQRGRGLSKLQERIRTAKNEQSVFQLATQESRKLLGVERVVIYQFAPDFSGTFISDSAVAGLTPLREIIPMIQDTHLQRTKGGRYKDGGCIAIDDIYLSGHEPCHIQLLEQMEARAYSIAPIFGADKQLWGLLAMYYSTKPYKWREDEVECLRQVGLQVGTAIEQLDYLSKLKVRAEQLQTINKITDRIRQTIKIDGIFQNVTQEIRTALQADRCVVYQFNEDWSGQVVAEAISGGWMSLLTEQDKDSVLVGDRTQNEVCVLRKWGSTNKTTTDTYLQESSGGRYAQGQKFTVVNDIYAQDFPECYINSLEKYQAKAYIIAPVFQDEKLWGLLAVYQNDAPRQWQTSDTELLTQIAGQLAVAVQLANYVERVEIQEKELAESLQRERSARENMEQEAVRVLMALEPSFRGDLTIRAPLSETEIGTIADGYNTTIQSLRSLVRQVQVSATSMSETSSYNNGLVENLASQAQREIDRLDSALTQVKLLASSSEEVANFAGKIDLAVQAANSTVQDGDRLMEKTVNEILEIRSTVSETGKKVKRLGETFQKISKVVSLVENFATQTNLLALNAAIEATRAGEYGKGFAVVADEVRSLAHQSANATNEISRLVDEIRAGTNEVTEAMEVGIAQVVQGTQMVNDTRQSLSEIVIATSEIGGLVQLITKAANNQNEESLTLTLVMNDVAEIVLNTADSANQLSESFKQLLITSSSLQTSVSRFKVD
jgi:methyl-accepting chemotaxis protein PixJ